VITPDGKTAYVTGDESIVVPIDTATNAPGAPINVGDEPFAITVTPDGKTVYVANTWENAGRLATAPTTVTPIARWRPACRERRSRPGASRGRSPSRP
jgi:YVTN family beta-propeller protein